jgi:hypothetical protein
LLTIPRDACASLDKCSPVLARNLERLAAQVDRKNQRGRRLLKAERTVQVLVADLFAACVAAATTQEEAAVRMRPTKCVVSRLESGVCTRQMPSTIERAQ